MHRQLIVAIETEIGNRDFTGLYQLFSDGKPNKIITLRTLTRAVLRHDARLVQALVFMRNRRGSQEILLPFYNKFLIFVWDHIFFVDRW